MTDRDPDPDDARLSSELAGWFAGEVRQAELDLRRAPLRPARARARRGPAHGIAAPAAGLILVVVLVLAGISRLPSLAGPAAEMTSSARPSSVTAPEPLTTASPVASGTVEGRYGDGIPMSLGGEPVLRIPDLDERAPRDDAPFLLGAWTVDWNGITMSCVLLSGTPPPFGPPRCNPRWLTDGPANRGASPLFLESWPSMPAGPVIVRIHRHDDRARLCEGTYRDRCEALGVIEDVVWIGDEATAAAPIGPIEAIQRLSGALPGLFDGTSLIPLRPDAAPAGPSADPGTCQPPYPQLSWAVLTGADVLATESVIRSILVFPTVGARERVDQDLWASGFNGQTPAGEGCAVIWDGMFTTEWIAVENVMVGVRYVGTNPGLPLVRETIRAALEGQGL